MRNISHVVGSLLLAVSLFGCSSDKSEVISDKAVEVKVVVITMFEIGEDSGDEAGEFQLWKEGQKLDTKFELEHGYHDLYYNAETGVLGMVTGMGISRATAAIMTLGLDSRFDLTNAYWLVSGIAGIDPEDGSIGSAAWATWLVDGDLKHHIDAREMPESWETGYFPLFSYEPYAESAKTSVDKNVNGEVYKINSELTDWAFELTKDIKLTGSPDVEALNAKYVNYPNAQKPPFVLKGDHLAASTFWHGKMLNDWANDWIKYWTNGEGNFVTSGMEDTGTYQALSYLEKAGKVDKSRFMVLRTASNYTMPHEGLTAAQNMKNENDGYAGMQPALKSGYLVGSKVVETITDSWELYKETMPYEVK